MKPGTEISIRERLMIPSAGILAWEACIILLFYVVKEDNLSLLIPGTAALVFSGFILYRYQKETRRGKGLCIAMIFLAAILTHSLFSTFGTVPEKTETAAYQYGRITTVKGYRSHTMFEAELYRDKNKKTEKLKGVLFFNETTALGKGSLFRLKRPCRPLKKSRSAKTLARRGIACSAWLTTAQVKVLSTPPGKLRDTLRHNLELRIHELYSDKNARLLKGLYFGNRHCIDPGTLYHFRRCGVLHLLAASGLHVAMVAAVPLFLFSFFSAGSPARYLPALAAVLSFVWMTDLPPSLMRAGIMFSLFVLLRVIHAEKEVFNILYLAALIILFISPWDIFSPGFHLSFGATLGILLFYEKLREGFFFLPAMIKNPLAVSLGAQIIAAPLIFFLIGEATPGGLLINLVMVPLVTLALYASMGTLAASYTFLGNPSFLSGITGGLLDAARGAADILQHFSGHGSVTANPWLAVVIIVPLTMVMLPGAMKKSRAAAGAVVLFLPILFLPGGDQPPLEKLLAGKGYQILVHQEKNTAYICGNISAFEGVQKIQELLIDRGVSSVHCTIPSPDWKNLSNWKRLMSTLPVTSCTIAASFSLSKAAEKFFTHVEQEKVKTSFLDFPPTPLSDKKNEKKKASTPANSIDSEAK